MALKVVLSGLASSGPATEFRPRVPMRSPVRRRRSCGVVPGVVGISLCDLPRVGVRGGTSSGSEAAVMDAGGGAASEGRMGVDVWRSITGGRERSGSLFLAQGLLRISVPSGCEDVSDMSLIVGVDGRESISSR